MRSAGRQRRLVVVALVAVAVGCGGDAPRVFSPARSSEALQELTVELAGARLGDDASLERAFDAIAARVTDLDELTASEYERRHGRGPHDDVTLMGSWLARLGQEHGSDVSTPALRDAAAGTIAATGLSSAFSEDDDVGDVVSAVLFAVSAGLPNEDSDNPRIPGAATLRSEFQSSAALVASLGEQP